MTCAPEPVAPAAEVDCDMLDCLHCFPIIFTLDTVLLCWLSWVAQLQPCSCLFVGVPLIGSLGPSTANWQLASKVSEVGSLCFVSWNGAIWAVILTPEERFVI